MLISDFTLLKIEVLVILLLKILFSNWAKICEVEIQTKIYQEQLDKEIDEERKEKGKKQLNRTEDIKETKKKILYELNPITLIQNNIKEVM